jgi:hypothetical protein
MGGQAFPVGAHGHARVFLSYGGLPGLRRKRENAYESTGVGDGRLRRGQMHCME